MIIYAELPLWFCKSISLSVTLPNRVFSEQFFTSILVLSFSISLLHFPFPLFSVSVIETDEQWDVIKQKTEQKPQRMSVCAFG